jgi:hypothetical protein
MPPEIGGKKARGDLLAELSRRAEDIVDARSTSIVLVLLAAVTGCGFSFGQSDIGGDDGLAAPNRRLRDDAGTEDTPPGPPPADDPIPADPSDAGSGGTDAAPTGPMKAFVSSETPTGNLGGVAGADALCNKLAKAAGLPGTYIAWISTANVNAIDRVTAAGPWQRVDGALVAQNKAQLASGQLANALRRDEKGQTPSVDEDRVWTATGPNGTYVGGSDCGAWTGAGDGRVGEAEHDGSKWTSLVDEACTEVNRVYCFQN